MKSVGIDGIVSMFGEIARAMKENRDYLIRLDNEIGDGDLGLTMDRGFSAAYEFAKANGAMAPSKMLSMAGMEIIKVAPSTMGTLMGSGFLRGGKAVGDAAEFGGAQLCAFYQGFLDGVLQRGKAVPGEKTIVDILMPVCEEAKKADGSDLSAVAKAAVKGAEIGMENEKGMMSQHGKAAVFREKTLNLVDPGSAAVKIMVEAIAKAFV